MSKIPLPPLPKKVAVDKHIPTDVLIYGYTPIQLRARDLEVVRCVLEAAARVLTEHQIPVGNSAAGEMACDWTYDALKECRAKIRALEVGHE